MSDNHVCAFDRNGICTDQDRDWCPSCAQCTEWSGEECSHCGHVWGECEECGNDHHPFLCGLHSEED